MFESQIGYGMKKEEEKLEREFSLVFFSSFEGKLRLSQFNKCNTGDI